MKNALVVGGILIVIAVGLYFFRDNLFGGPAAVGLTSDTIKVGAIFALSNSYLTPGAEAEKRSVDMAVEEINAQGGIDGKLVEVVYQDQQGDNPQGAVSAYYNLTAQGIRLIIGPDATPAANALSPLVDRDRVVLIAASVGSEKFAPASEYTFDTWQADQINSFALGEYLYSIGHRSIAILGSQQEWERTQAEAVKKSFEDAGGVVAVFELPLVSDLNLRSEALRIKNSNPDAVVFTNYGEVMVASQRVRGVGVQAPFYSTVFDDSQIEKAQGALEGAISISSFTPTEAFVKKYETRWGEAVKIEADTAYDAAWILFTAIDRANSTDPENVKDELQKIRTWSGASGELTFDEFGGVRKAPVFYIVRGNTNVPYTP